MRAQITNRDYEQISAYIDGQLAPGDQRKLEERLHARPELQEVLNELRQTRALLRTAPRRRAPRNFTLTPAMVGDIGPKKKTALFGGLFPTLSFASAVAAFALVATLLFQLIPGSTLTGANSPSNRTMTKESAPTDAALQAPAAAEPQVAATAPAGAETMKSAASGETAGEAGTPPIINWSPGGRGGGGGGAPDSGIASQPACPGGMCGGAADSPAVGMGGAGGLGGGGGSSWATGGGAPDGQINLPPQSVQSLPGTENQAAQAAVQPDASISGSGPILGVPAAGEGGQIIKQDSLAGNEPSGSVPAPVEEQPAAGQTPQAYRTLWGLPVLRLVQILLAVIAVTSGVAAFSIRKRR
jgi:hypothetical protein